MTSRHRYAELHAHSAYSFLDGANEPDDLASAAVELGLEALALTDHDGVPGIVKHAQAGRVHGLPTIHGTELTSPMAPTYLSWLAILSATTAWSRPSPSTTWMPENAEIQPMTCPLSPRPSALPPPARPGEQPEPASSSPAPPTAPCAAPWATPSGQAPGTWLRQATAWDDSPTFSPLPTGAAHPVLAPWPAAHRLREMPSSAWPSSSPWTVAPPTPRSPKS